MLDPIQSRWMTLDSWSGQPLWSLSAPVEEGMMLCGGVFEDGLQKAFVAPNPTAAANPFLGMAFSYYTVPNQLIAVETWMVPANAPYTVALNNPALNPTTMIAVKDTANAANYTYNSASGAGNFQVSGNTLTFNAAQAGRVVTVTYAYAPTVAAVAAAVGDGYIGNTKPSDVTGTIGLIRRCTVCYTTNFNPGVDYTTPNLALYVGANGIIDPTNTGGPVIPGYVYGLPSADFPYLGITFSAV